MSSTTVEEPQTFSFQAEVNQVLSLVINSLYSHKEIFLRELVSNASDALDKIKFQSLTDHDILGEDRDLKIQIIPDEENRRLTIRDTGVGMSREELIKNLGTVAHSGSQAFMEALRQDKRDKDLQLIGQFGVGFYSSYLVADRVEVKSRPARAEQAHLWASDGKGNFTVEPCELSHRGTEITLHLKEEHDEYAREWRLRELVRKFSDFVSFPIELEVSRTREEESVLTDVKGEKTKHKVTEKSFEQVNSASALWRRNKTDITDEQYNEFYKHLGHDWTEPLARTHFQIEGRTLFTGLVFIPKRRPFDLFTSPDKRGVRLFVKRVFIMDDCKELVPEYLRFIRGVVDSDDLPLNVSREILQDDTMITFIRNQLAKKTLDLLQELADGKKEDYETFWTNFGPVLKEGLHTDSKNKDKLAKLLRFFSTKSPNKLTSLDEYLERMPADQKAIYYVIGESQKALEKSPHLEALKKKDFEVIFLTDPIDEWVTMSLEQYKEKELASVAKGELKLEDEAASKAVAEKKKELEGFVGKVAEILGERVEKVELSQRLADSPCCLVVPEHGIHAHLERLLRQNNREVPSAKRIFEINAEHPLIVKVRDLFEQNSDKLTDWVELLYGQALILEGSPIDDPAAFAARLGKLMLDSAETKQG